MLLPAVETVFNRSCIKDPKCNASVLHLVCHSAVIARLTNFMFESQTTCQLQSRLSLKSGVDRERTCWACLPRVVSAAEVP